jgi:hypothetical protein
MSACVSSCTSVAMRPSSVELAPKNLGRVGGWVVVGLGSLGWGGLGRLGASAGAAWRAGRGCAAATLRQAELHHHMRTLTSRC